MLKSKAREAFDIKDGQHIEVAKFIPHEFNWRHLDGGEIVEVKAGKKKKTVQPTKLSNLDLRQFPVFLQDGDIIGVRLESENKDKQDDFQTEADSRAKAEFNLKREARRKQMEQERKNKNAKRAGDEHSLVINLD